MKNHKLKINYVVHNWSMYRLTKTFILVRSWYAINIVMFYGKFWTDEMNGLFKRVALK